MLYFFSGSDSDTARAHARAVIAVMKKKRAGAEYFRVTPQDWNPASFEQFVGGQGLFEQKCIVFADGLFENTEAKEWALEHLPALAESENAFVFLERKVDAASLKKIEKVAQEAKRFDVAEVSKGFGRSHGNFNVFSLADALGVHNKKQLWSLLAEAFMNGASGEEINGILFWKVKTLLASQKSAGGVSARFSVSDLEQLSRSLISSYHDAHRGLSDLPTSLERIALKL